MKKCVAVLLGLLFVFAFALVACGDETADETETTAAEATETTAAEASGGPVDWTQAVDYEGEVVTITGEVGGISNLFEEKGIGKAMVHLGGAKAEDHFNVTFVLDVEDGTWPEYLSEMESQFNQELIGKTMEVTGTIRLNSFESCFEILVNDADDNTLPDDAATATWVIK